MGPGGGPDDFVESRVCSPTTTSPRSRSCRFTARGGGEPAASPLLLPRGTGWSRRAERSTARLLEKRNSSILHEGPHLSVTPPDHKT